MMYSIDVDDRCWMMLLMVDDGWWMIYNIDVVVGC